MDLDDLIRQMDEEGISVNSGAYNGYVLKYLISNQYLLIMLLQEVLKLRALVKGLEQSETTEKVQARMDEIMKDVDRLVSDQMNETLQKLMQ